jgi:predicted RNA-binding protein with PUA domain
MKKIQRINITVVEKVINNTVICEKIVELEPVLVKEDHVIMIEQGNLQGVSCYVITLTTGDKIFTDNIKPIIGYSTKL